MVINRRKAWSGRTPLARRQKGSFLSRFRRHRGFTPAEMVVLSFLGLIAAGTLALKLLPGVTKETPLTWIDALFTSTSAVCVTGLAVVDTAQFFTWLGQLIILVQIQLGGLGMLLLTSLIITAFGGRPSLRTETAYTGVRNILPHVTSRRLITDVAKFTFLVEALGALALYLLRGPRLGWREAVWPSIFHSVSAFCNAGFSTWSDSVVGMGDSPATLIVISLLIITGGIGFIVMEELYLIGFQKKKKHRRRMSVHTRLVLVCSGLLVAVGWLLFALFEWNGVLRDMAPVDRIFNSYFMSVTPRTAGFNTINYGSAENSTNFLTVILMMIGGSPGSTAGGMKTTTFALIGLLAWSRIRSQPTATFAGRSIPEDTIQKAMGLFVIATGIVVLGVFVLLIGGTISGADRPFLDYLFETASAFNTVGLSMGLTMDLPPFSRVFVSFLMFAGRVGPVALATALTVRLSERSHFRLAHEDVVIG